MNDSILFLEDFQKKLKSSKTLIYCAALICCTVIVCMTWLCMNVISRSGDQIYVLDNGSVLSALRGTNDVQRDLEAMDHVARFHELFFTMAPNQESINSNVDRALNLADASAYNYYSDLKEQQYFTRLIQANAMQQIVVDSVRIDMGAYPYKASCYATIDLIRETNITRYSFESSCTISEVSRTDSNPHGLQIGKFTVVKYDKGETRRRQ